MGKNKTELRTFLKHINGLEVGAKHFCPPCNRDRAEDLSLVKDLRKS
jgi:hypothetical protein